MGERCDGNYCDICPIQEIESHVRRSAAGQLLVDVIRWHDNSQLASYSTEELRKVIWDESSVRYFFDHSTSEDIEIVAKSLEIKLAGDCQQKEFKVN